MLRLELMPLVPDFGEGMETSKKVNPNTRLKLARDYRIFGQFSNFPDVPDEEPDHVIQTQALPDGLTVGSASEEDGVVFDRRDESGEISWVHAKELKALSIPEDTNPVNKAVKAYIDQLPDEMVVLLKWD